MKYLNVKDTLLSVTKCYKLIDMALKSFGINEKSTSYHVLLIFMVRIYQYLNMEQNLFNIENKKNSING